MPIGQVGIFATSTGGSGLTGADAGNVVVRQSGAVSTASDFGAGIRAQSLAGLPLYSYGSSGRAGAVAVTATGSIVTRGDSSPGIYALSKGATTGAMTINSSSAIATSGAGAHGILASNTALSAPASIVVTATGSISALGAASDGVRAVNGSRTGVTSIEIGRAMITGGSGTGAGVTIIGGADITLSNAGAVSALSGTAMRGGSGNESVRNTGIVTGNVELAGGANSFDNQRSGILNSGATVDLGRGNTLTNSGAIAPGGMGAFRHTLLTGNLVQTKTGRLLVDIDMKGGTSDKVTVSGTANLAGTIVVAPSRIALRPQQFTIVSAEGGTTAPGLSLQALPALQASPALQAQLLTPDANNVVLATSLDFSVGGLSPNQTAIGDALNAAAAANGGGVEPVLLSLLGLPSMEAYQRALDQLSPSTLAQMAMTSISAAQTLAGNMLSCKVNGEDGAAIVREGQCVWVRAGTQRLDISTSGVNPGLRERTDSFSTGVQLAVAPEWRVGFALGYDQSNSRSGSNLHSEGDRISVGGVVKYTHGPALLAASGVAGFGTYDTLRHLAFGSIDGIARSSNDVDFAGGRLHASYLYDLGDWYMRPLVDGGVTVVSRGGFTEQGTTGAELFARGQSDTVWSISPALELGSQTNSADGTAWRPFLRVGASWLSESDFAVSAGFANAPGDVTPFSVQSSFDDTLLDLGAGIDVLATSGITLRLQYDGRFGEETRQNGFSVKGSVPF